MDDSRVYWARVRKHYDLHDCQIRQAGKRAWGIDPYAWDFEAGIRMTPIEAAIWHDIRAEGAVLYPQYPVAGHFVDFGNPMALVGIECDGAQWHQDKERDAARQKRIEAAGWKLYRVTGSDCVKLDDHSDDDLGRPRTLFNPARTLIRDLCDEYGIRL